MRRLTILLLALSALPAACGGEDRSAEIEQLQADAEALRTEVAYLSGELEIAQSERDRAQEELAQARADLARQAEAAAAQAVADDAPNNTAEAAPASDEVRAYFQRVEEIAHGFAAAGEEIIAKMDALALRGDLAGTKALFEDLAELQAKAVGEAVALAPPPGLASLHGEAAAAERAFAEVMADYARAVAEVTTWDQFALVVETFPQRPAFLAAADRSVATCYALQEAAAASGVTVDLRCEGL